MSTLQLLRNKYVLFVVAMRVSGYIYMLYRPLEGMILSIFLDILDWFILSFGKFKKEDYHKIDKPLDYLQYLFLIPIVFNTYIFEAYMLLLGWRTIGQIIASKTGNRALYFFFPNIAEYLALLYFIKVRFNLNIELDAWFIVAGLITFKLVQEYWIHIKKASHSWHIGIDFRTKVLKWS